MKLSDEVLAAMERHFPVSRGVRWFVTTLPESTLLGYLIVIHRELERILHVRTTPPVP